MARRLLIVNEVKISDGPARGLDNDRRCEAGYVWARNAKPAPASSGFSFLESVKPRQNEAINGALCIICFQFSSRG